MVNITIDGKNLQVPEGTTVLRAAQAAGIHIPTLCDHPKVTPYGGCRLCLVEVEGARTLQPSCTLPANNNMIVHTDTEKVRGARKFVLTMLFSERNHFCPYCQVSGGDCELQNAAYEQDMTHWPLQPNWQPYPVDASHPFFVLDHNRCILCRRCVRACGELVGNYTLGFEERGAKSFLVADLGTPLGESTCVSCGTCVQICPTGALIDRRSAYHGRETQVDHTESICVGCSVGCSIDVLTRNNQIVRIEGNWDAPINGGVLCKTGRFLPVEEDSERLATPMIRVDGKLKAATWDQALDVVAEKLKALQGKNGSGLAALASTRLPVETLALFKEVFADHLKSSLVTSLEEGTATAAASKLAEELGQPFEGKLQALQSAECVVMAGVDLVNEHEVAGFFVKRIVPLGTRLVTLDAVENPLDALADFALKVKKGAEAQALQGLAATIVKLGLAKGELPALPEGALEKAGIPVETLQEAARTIASAKNPVFIYGEGLVAGESAQALHALLALANLCEAAPAVLSPKGKANSMAAAQYRLDKPFKLDGQQAVYVALGDDTINQKLLQRLEKVPFLVVQASYTSPLTTLADVVLPVEMWAEMEGHYVSLDGTVQQARKSLVAPEGVWSNSAVLEAVADRLGAKTGSADWQQQLHARVASVAISTL
ncbi:MAG: molybdopterin-dependent oxidoreductase [Chloroflexi bacterium]|nr:molybdopterin-dependent oxidoreductase [Chloroflexota bacterium]